MKDLTVLQPQRHIQEIDALRGIAISSVVILHWIFQPLSPILAELGIKEMLNLFAYGVDLFFVISGFLIGGILLKAGKRPASMATLLF
jgi:peptidoglycan/LPS O-acetylase OafA/YrhL